MIEFENSASAREIFELEKICFEEPWNLDQISSHLKNHLVILMKENNFNISYVLYLKSFDEIEILRIAVHPEKRKSKFGTLLIQNLIQINSAKKIFLDVNEENISAIKFYEKNSFQKIGVRKKYYTNRKDAILFLKEVNMNRKNFIFKPNLYKDYFVNFSGPDKNLIGILGYMNEFEICIVHKGMKVSDDMKDIHGYVKRRSQSEKIDYHGNIDQIEHKTHKSRNYTFIWLKFTKPVILSENLIAIEMANFSEED